MGHGAVSVQPEKDLATRLAFRSSLQVLTPTAPSIAPPMTRASDASFFHCLYTQLRWYVLRGTGCNVPLETVPIGSVQLSEFDQSAPVWVWKSRDFTTLPRVVFLRDMFPGSCFCAEKHDLGRQKCPQNMSLWTFRCDEAPFEVT